MVYKYKKIKKKEKKIESKYNQNIFYINFQMFPILRMKMLC